MKRVQCSKLAMESCTRKISKCKKKTGEACGTGEASSLQDRYSARRLKTQPMPVTAKEIWATNGYKTTKSNSREKMARLETGIALCNGIVHREDEQVLKKKLGSVRNR